MSATYQSEIGCELCQSHEFDRVAEQDRRGEPLATVLCRRCGLIRHAEPPTDEQLRTFYESQYRESYHGETAPSDRRVMRAWGSAERIFGRLATRLAPRCRVLEIGAGIGCTVKRFGQAGFNAWGVEPHAGFYRYGRRQLGSLLQNRHLADLTPSGDHDLVLLVHVIEHFNHPLRALQQIAAQLSPDGRLYVECPNVAAPFARKSKMFHFAHVYNFSPLTLEWLAMQAGFAAEHWFSQPDSPNLEVLLRLANSVDSFESMPLAEGYRRSRQALRQAAGWRYYARRVYWRQRAERLSSYVREFLRAAPFAAALQRKRQSSTQPSNAAPLVDSREGVA